MARGGGWRSRCTSSPVVFGCSDFRFQPAIVLNPQILRGKVVGSNLLVGGGGCNLPDRESPRADVQIVLWRIPAPVWIRNETSSRNRRYVKKTGTYYILCNIAPHVSRDLPDVLPAPAAAHLPALTCAIRSLAFPSSGFFLALAESNPDLPRWVHSFGESLLCCIDGSETYVLFVFSQAQGWQLPFFLRTVLRSSLNELRYQMEGSTARHRSGMSSLYSFLEILPRRYRPAAARFQLLHFQIGLCRERKKGGKQCLLTRPGN